MRQLKTCTKCGDALPATDQYFYVEKRNKSGLTGKCRECFKTRTREWLLENREYVSQRLKDYRSQNHAHVLALEKASRDRNRDAKIERDRRYYQDNRRAVLDRQRKYYEKQQENIRAKVRAWTAANPDKVSQQSAKKRARKREATVGIVCYETLLDEHGMTCHICGRAIESPEELHIDHVIPLARGGSHSMGNLRPAHDICNLRKGTRLIGEF